MARTVVLYETSSGTRPVEKFLNKLDAATKAKVLAVIRHVQQDDTVSPVLFCKMASTNALWEMRVKHRVNIYRLLCFFDGARLVVAAHGFQKKTQKTPRQEIQTAEARKKDYFRRKP